MARIRTIKPEFPQSETIGALSRDARLLFVQLWTLADDAGRLRGASRMLASLLYPYDDDAPGLMPTWLAELEEKQCIRRYEVEGAQYIEIINWLKHQKIDRPSESRIPEFVEGSSKPREESRALDADLGPRTSTKTSTEDAPSGASSKYFFETGCIRLTERDFRKWQEAFTNLQLKAELISLAQWAETQGQNWFHAVSGALAKRNRQIGEARKSPPQPQQPMNKAQELYRQGLV
jgi:hypothetical protein